MVVVIPDLEWAAFRFTSEDHIALIWLPAGYEVSELIKLFDQKGVQRLQSWKASVSKVVDQISAFLLLEGVRLCLFERLSKLHLEVHYLDT